MGQLTDSNPSSEGPNQLPTLTDEKGRLSVDEALSVLDATLRLTTQRSIFTTDEVMNALLDVRQALTRHPASEEPVELVPA